MFSGRNSLCFRNKFFYSYLKWQIETEIWQATYCKTEPLCLICGVCLERLSDYLFLHYLCIKLVSHPSLRKTTLLLCFLFQTKFWCSYVVIVTTGLVNCNWNPVTFSCLWNTSSSRTGFPFAASSHQHFAEREEKGCIIKAEICSSDVNVVQTTALIL